MHALCYPCCTGEEQFAFPLEASRILSVPLAPCSVTQATWHFQVHVCLFFGSNSSLCWIYIPFWRGLPLFPADVLSRTNTIVSPQVACCHRHLAQSLCSSQTVAFPQLWLPAASWSPNFSSRFYVLFGKTFLFLFQAFLAASGERFLVSFVSVLRPGLQSKSRVAFPGQGSLWISLSALRL